MLKTCMLWVNQFVTERRQVVRYSDAVSNSLHTLTGAPQGLVIFPVLSKLYKDVCRSSRMTVNIIIKFQEQHNYRFSILF